MQTLAREADMSDEHWAELERVAAPGRSATAQRQSGAALWLSLKGRIPRSTYWLKFMLPIGALYFVGAMVDYANGYVNGAGPAYGIVVLLTLWPCLVGTVKRLHDLGHSGWYVVVLYGGLFLGGAVLAVAVPTLGETALLLLIPVGLLCLAMLWYTLKMGFFRGTFGRNPYGPDPLAA